MKPVIAFVCLLLNLLLSASPAMAHSPYFTESASFEHPDFGTVSMKLLHGDGVIVADPVRAVVLDDEGVLLAASPLAVALHLYCPDPAAACLVYDRLNRQIMETGPASWHRNIAAAEAGRALVYPEYLPEESGFTSRPATLSEVLGSEVSYLASYKLKAAIAIIWWSLFWLMTGPVALRLIGRGRRINLWSIAARISGGLLFLLVTVFVWSVAPASSIYLVVVVSAGLLLAWAFWRMKAGLSA